MSTPESNPDHTQAEYGLKEGAEEFPLMTVIGLSYVCNSRCPSCPYTNSDIRSTYSDRTFMAEDTFRLIADEVGAHQAWLRISGGGEPMLHPQAVPLLEYAKAKGCKVGLITNGSRFDQSSLTRLLECGLDMIELSVDAGDEETYNRVRPGLNWTRLVESAKMAMAMRDRMGANTKVICSVVNQEGVDVETAAEFWQPLVDEVQKRKYLTWSINDDHSADTTPYLPPEDRVPCPFLFERLNIDSRGKIMVCGFDVRAVTNMGNVHDKSIKEIWHGKGFNYFREKHLARRGDDIPMCRQCPDWKYRSWKHNYWKIVGNAEKKRQAKLTGAGE